MLFMRCFDPLPCRRGMPDTLKVASRALHRDLGHGKASWSLLFFACQLLTKGSYSQHLVLPWGSRRGPLLSWSCNIIAYREEDKGKAP
ncbi:hypothetical protein BHE74_00056072 [Ensete ventricosum]|nr:hypothetical protein BHE74_00056072 [Ensete ventricosum]RZS26026.1 hypothetical protein BHM03_00059323 [Ensete ventricosum]